MKNLDLYKVIIIISLLLLPAAGYWWWTIEQEIDIGTKAVAREKTASGFLAQIGAKQGDWESVQRNQRKTQNIQDHRVFFQRMLMVSARGGSISPEEFTIQDENIKPAVGVKGAQDVTVDIKFDIKELQRDYIRALLFNVESQAPVWRLRHLRMKNVDVSGTSKAPPDELRDLWEVSNLAFVRRKGGA